MERLLTKDEMTVLAIQYLKDLGIYQPYIDEFTQKGEVTMFENFAGFWVRQYSTLSAKIQEFEKENEVIVYAVTHEYTELGEMYDFLYVSKYAEDEEYNFEPYEKSTIVNAYVWNVTDPDCSEFGSIGVSACAGGIARAY